MVGEDIPFIGVIIIVSGVGIVGVAKGFPLVDVDGEFADAGAGTFKNHLSVFFGAGGCCEAEDGDKQA